MEFNFDGKKALVTGAGKGFGRATAIALAKGGAVTHALSRTQSDLDSLKEEVPEIHVYQIDLSDWEKTRKLVEDIGPIDLLVNNAGIGIPATFLNMKVEDFDRTIDTNVKSAINVSQVVIPGMLKRGTGGSIVNISSVVASFVCPYLFGYSVSKAAMDHVTKLMAAEFGPHQIRVNSINPTIAWTKLALGAWTTTEEGRKARDAFLARVAQGKVAEIPDVVHAILYLLSDKADMITGTSLAIDGGQLVT